MRGPQISCYNGPLYHDLAPHVEPSAQRGRVFLVAVHGEEIERHGRGSFDRVHVMVIDPHQMADFSHPLSVLCALPDAKPGIAAIAPPRGLLAVKSRPVCGEILRNQEGEFYERRGNRLVRLRNLVSGPKGEVIEFLPPSQDQHRGWNGAPDIAEYIETEGAPHEPEEFRESSASHDPARESGRRRVDQFVRKLFSDPGQLRLLSYGDFSNSLSSQLKHPERLRDTHQLPCYLQVYEIRRPMSLQNLAATFGEDPAQLHPLNAWSAERLGLSSLFSALRQIPPVTRPTLTPGALVCRLQVVRDPTACLESSGAVSPRTASSDLSPSQAPTQMSAPARGRTTIPECYLKPWEFKLSREEVLYDLNAQSAPRGWLKRFFSAFRERVRRRDFQRWTALLANKNVEEQLWGVRPPQHGLNATSIRNWVCNALSLAGYDAHTMLAEWQIYWRRKGVC